VSKFYIQYTDGTRRVFTASTVAEAYHYFMMEGDHAVCWGRVEDE